MRTSQAHRGRKHSAALVTNTGLGGCYPTSPKLLPLRTTLRSGRGAMGTSSMALSVSPRMPFEQASTYTTV
eukprot:790968-Amphidinium_carterae.3